MRLNPERAMHKLPPRSPLATMQSRSGDAKHLVARAAPHSSLLTKAPAGNMILVSGVGDAAYVCCIFNRNPGCCALLTQHSRLVNPFTCSEEHTTSCCIQHNPPTSTPKCSNHKNHKSIGRTADRSLGSAGPTTLNSHQSVINRFS